MLNQYKLLIGLLVTCLLVYFCVLFLDKPIAYFMNQEFTLRGLVFRPINQVLPVFEIISVLGVLYVAIKALDCPLTKARTVILLCSLSLIIASEAKDLLKFVFGRSWPDTWMSNPSLIRDGLYSFNFLHGGPNYNSFPSGHTTAICALASVLWLCYPKYRVFYGAAILCVALALLINNFHFLGDILAGGFLGLSIGWATVTLWQTNTQQQQ